MSEKINVIAKSRNDSPIEQHIHQGPSVNEIEKIVNSIVDNKILQYKNEALKEANERNKYFINKLIEVFASRSPSSIEGFKNPSFQYALFEAQKGCIRTGDEDLTDVLVDVLVDRLEQKDRNLRQIVLEESINVISKLTAEQLDTLTIIFLLNYSFNNTIGSFDMLKKYLDDEIKLFCNSLSKENSLYQHLEYAGCASVSIGSSSIESIFERNYRGLFFEGFGSDIVDKLQSMGMTAEAFANLIIPCINNSEKIQLSPINTKVLEKRILELKIGENISKELEKIFDQYILSNEKIKNKLIELGEGFMDKLFDTWDDSSMGHTSLTSVGIAIAQANYRRKTGKSINLGIWIK